jgi:HSP20 family molecular chaperone IbpA
MSTATGEGVSPANAPAIPSDWAGSPLSTIHHDATQAQPIPIEQYPDGDSYVIRLEIPGIDPATGLTVTVETGALSVLAERRDSAPEGCESEFRYGSFARHVALPPGASVQDDAASCRNGILTVRIGMEPEANNGSRDRRCDRAMTAVDHQSRRQDRRPS